MAATVAVLTRERKRERSNGEYPSCSHCLIFVSISESDKNVCFNVGLLSFFRKKKARGKFDFINHKYRIPH